MGEEGSGEAGKMERQRSLWGRKSLNPVAELKLAMNLAAKGCGLSRGQLAERLNGLIALNGLRTKGRDGQVTEAMLDKWLAPEPGTVIPLKLVAAFCAAAESLAPLQALAGPVGGQVIGPEEQVLLEMARAQVQEKEAGRKKRRLEEQWKDLRK